MDQYKISQTPGKGSKKPYKRKVKTPTRRDARSLDPQMIMVVVALVLVLVLGGVAWAHFFHKSSSQTGSVIGTANGKGKGSSGAATAVPGRAFTDVTTAISNKKVGALKIYYAKNVHVVIAKSSLNQTLGSAQADGVIANPLNAAQTPWDWHVSPGALAAWQMGPYGQYFTGNVIVGISADGTVISIHFDSNGQIDVVFVAPVGDLTTPPVTSGGAAGSTGSAGGTTTTPVISPSADPATTD